MTESQFERLALINGKVRGPRGVFEISRADVCFLVDLVAETENARVVLEGKVRADHETNKLHAEIRADVEKLAELKREIQFLRAGIAASEAPAPAEPEVPA